MNRRVLLFLAAIWATVAAAQPRYSMSHYGNADGLPSNGIRGLEWDAANQLLWIGTEGGLVRWDGSNFETVAGTGGRVMVMGPTDASGSRIYVWCENDSTYIIEQGSVRPWRGASDPVRIAHARVNGARLITTNLSGQPGTLAFTGTMAQVGPTADVLLLFSGKNLYLKEGARTRVLRSEVRSCEFAPNGNGVIVNINGELWTIDNHEKELHRVFFRNDSGNGLLTIPNDGKPPMLYRSGILYRLLPRAGSYAWAVEPVFDGLPPGTQPFVVRELSPAGPILIADRISGLYVLRQKSIRQLTDTTGVISGPQLVTYGQALLPDGHVASHSGVVYDRKGPLRGVRIPVGGSQDLLRFGNHLYFTNDGFLFRYDLRTQTSEQFAQLDSSDWTTIGATPTELYVIGGYGVRRLVEGGLEEVYRFPSTANIHGLRNATAIGWSAGVLLLGSNNYIRFLDIGRQQLRAIKVSEKAPVRHIWRRPYGAFICTYGEGIFLYRDNRVYRLPMDKSGFVRFAHAIAPDGHGFCYVSTNNGLFRVSEEALLQAATTGDPVYYHFLGHEDGLEQTELNGGGVPAYLRLPDGTLSFPTMSGLAQLHPDSVHIAPPPGAILVRASVDGQEIGSFPAQLSARQQLVQFDVTVPFWGSTQNLYAWYRLRRSSDEAGSTPWIAFNPVKQRYFNFTALQPDRYQFEIRTFNGFAPGNFALRSLRFEVAPPWYATRPFVLLWVLLLGGLLWLTIFLRTRQLRARSLQLEATVRHRTQEIEQQKQQLGQQLQLVSEAHDLKERLISVISHNIITPLRYIHRATTMMRDDARSLDPALREKAIDSINDTSLELELLSVNLLNWIRLQHKQTHVEPEWFTFEEIAEHVKSLLGAVARSRGQVISVAPAGVPEIYQFKDALNVILYNLALNAITHSEGTSTVLSCREEKDGFVISVCDDGRGIPDPVRRKLLGETVPGAMKETDNQGTGFGFIIIRDLVRYIGGTLRIEAGGPGTRIEVCFPSRGEHRT